jgi:perosamine synthetase
MLDNRLALFGGKPLVMEHASLRMAWPIITKKDRRAIIKSFDQGDFSGRGSREVYALEKEMAEYFKMPYATALNSGTAALHVALASLDIGKNDEVIVPNLTFIATAMAVVHNGSIPVFADIDPRTFNITAETILPKITRKSKAVIVVHLHGFPADIHGIKKICKERKMALIEDVAQAPGALLDGKPIGSFGDASAFSLMSQKNLATCGECGILLNRKLAAKNRAEMVRIYGEILKPNASRSYNSYTLGWNYTLNPIQAAMARVQLIGFDSLTHKIRSAGQHLDKGLSAFPWVIPPQDIHGAQGVYHFYRIGFDPLVFGYAHSGRFRKAVQDALDAEGLNVRHYQNVPVSGQPIFITNIRSSYKKSFEIKNFPNTLEVIRSTLVLGAISSAPGYLLCPGTIEKYLKGFAKINANMAQIIDYADRLTYREPWEDIPKIPDSFQSRYGMLRK